MTETLTLEPPFEEQAVLEEKASVCHEPLSADTHAPLDISPTGRCEAEESTDVWSRGL